MPPTRGFPCAVTSNTPSPNPPPSPNLDRARTRLRRRDSISLTPPRSSPTTSNLQSEPTARRRATWRDQITTIRYPIFTPPHPLPPPVQHGRFPNEPNPPTGAPTKWEDVHTHLALGLLLRQRLGDLRLHLI